MFNTQHFLSSLGKYFAPHQSLGNCYGLTMEGSLSALFVSLTSDSESFNNLAISYSLNTRQQFSHLSPNGKDISQKI